MGVTGESRRGRREAEMGVEKIVYLNKNRKLFRNKVQSYATCRKTNASKGNHNRCVNQVSGGEIPGFLLIPEVKLYNDIMVQSHVCMCDIAMEGDPEEWSEKGEGVCSMHIRYKGKYPFAVQNHEQ